MLVLGLGFGIFIILSELLYKLLFNDSSSFSLFCIGIFLVDAILLILLIMLNSFVNIFVNLFWSKFCDVFIFGEICLDLSCSWNEFIFLIC